MRRLYKSTIKLGKGIVSRVPYARDRYFEWEYLRTPCGCKGLYRSFAEAQADVPPGKLAGYDNEGLGDFYKGSIGYFNPSDQPVVDWLTRLAPDARVVFELGGSIGLGYYAYQPRVPGLERLRWIVCDVPEVARAGEQIARERNVPNLEFTADRQKADGADIYASFGALQYIEEPFAKIIGALPVPPRHILLNRVPLWDGKPFITLQNNIDWFSPYKIDNFDAFVQSLADLGYEKVASWKLDRSLTVIKEPAYTVQNYQGLYFRLK